MALADQLILGTLEAARSLGGGAKAARMAGKGRDHLLQNRLPGLAFQSWADLVDAWELDLHRFVAWSTAVHRNDPQRALDPIGHMASGLAKKRAEPESAQALRLAYLRGHLQSTDPENDDLQKLRLIDRLRYKDPRKAARQAEEIATSTRCAPTAAHALASWASALRLIHTAPRRLPTRLNQAHTLLWMSLRMAAAEDLPVLFADGLQRLVYVTVDRDPATDLALRLARAHVAAIERFATAEDRDLRGRGLAVLAFVLYKEDSRHEARVCLARSLELLEPHSTRHRAAAFQTLALLAAKDRDLDAAETWADQLHQVSQTTVPEWSARTSWLRARIAVRRGDLAAAATFYDRTLVDLSNGARPVDVALAGAEAVHVLLGLGRETEAKSLTRSLRWCVLPLERELPAAAAALTALVKAHYGTEHVQLRAAARLLIQTVGAAHGPAELPINLA